MIGAVSATRLLFTVVVVLISARVAFFPIVIGWVEAIEPFAPLRVRVGPDWVLFEMRDQTVVGPEYVFALVSVSPVVVLNFWTTSPPLPLMTPLMVPVDGPSATTRFEFAVKLFATVRVLLNRMAPPFAVTAAD